jgi:ABC-2 type transport system permease protein
MSDARAPTSPTSPKVAQRRLGVILAIAAKEIRELSRDGRFRIALVAVAGLLAVALLLGRRQARAAHAEREAAQAIADEHFREQDAKNPHVAAHYGTYVFKPQGALTFVDPGIEPFVGVSVKLEAHKRSPLEGARAKDGTALARFGRLSAASVLQLLVPLLVVGLGFAAWTGERERGTLRQIASLGVPVRVMLAGKALGIAGALAALVGPAIVIGAVFMAALAERSAEAPESAARLAWLSAAYATYFAAFIAVTLFASSVAPSSRFALVALLGFWVISGLVVPRAAADAAAVLAKAPTQAEIAGAVRASLETGLPGGPAREQRVAAITEALLEREGFKGAETLMDASLLEGLELQAEATFENEVIDHHFGRLGDAIERQDRLVQWASVVSPLLAVRSLSMAFAGTDTAHHRHFADAAESHRRALVDMLNRDFAEKAGAAGWDYKASRELWERAPALAYRPPSAAWVIRRQAVSLGALVGWLVLGAAAAWRAASRMRVVG